MADAVLCGLLSAKRAIEVAFALVAAVLEVLDEGQTQGVNECTQRRHSEVQQVTDDQYDDERQPFPCSTFRGATHNHQAEVVECAAEHTACQTKGIQTDVRERIAQDTCSHVVGVPQSCTDIQQRVSARGVEHVDAECRDTCDDD